MKKNIALQEVLQKKSILTRLLLLFLNIYIFLQDFHYLNINIWVCHNLYSYFKTFCPLNQDDMVQPKIW